MRALVRSQVRSRGAALYGAVVFVLTPLVLVYCVAGAVTDMLNLWPWALALWASYLLLLLPALGLTERPHFAADRYGYLPGLVWAVVIAAALRRLADYPALRAAGFALVMALALRPVPRSTAGRLSPISPALSPRLSVSP